MAKYPPDLDMSGTISSRREFIQKLIIKFGYAAPLVTSFTVAEIGEAGPAGMMMMGMGMMISRPAMMMGGGGDGRGFPG